MAEKNEKSKDSLFDEITATTQVEGSLPLLNPIHSKHVADTTRSQTNARVTRLRAAELFLEACALEATIDSKIPGIVFEHKLIINYDDKCFVKTTARAEKTLSCILKGKLFGGVVCPIKNLSRAERAALEEHVRLLNKSVAKRVAVIINPVYFASK
ncbi:MAG: hypothetical protein QW343_01740 [Candidatus Norongarragalinales archaeon]